MKEQVLANFIIECIWSNKKANLGKIKEECPEPMWILYVDEESNSLSNGVGLILTNQKG